MRNKFLLTLILIGIWFLACAGIQRMQTKKSVEQQYKAVSANPEAVRHFIRGTTSEMIGDFRSALLEFNEALLHDSSSATIYNKVAENYIRLEKYESAEKILRAAIRRFPNQIDSYRALASIYHAQQRFQDAEIVYRKILQLDPSDIETRYALIALYMAQQKDLKVANQYEELLQLGYGNPEMLLRLANIYLENQLFDKSEKKFLEFYQQYPEDERAYLGMAKYYLTRSDTAAAIDWYQRGLNRDASFGTCLEELNEIYAKQKRWEEAIQTIEQTIARDSLRIENYLRLGELHFDRGDTARSIEQFEQIVKRFPNDFRAYFSIGSIYFQSNRMDAAIPWLKKSVELNKEFPRGWILLGFSYLRSQQTEMAETHFREAVDALPDHPDINFFLGSVLNQRHKSDEAVPYLEKSIALKSNYAVDALGTLAMIYDEKKMHQKSDSLYEIALRAKPNDPLLMNNYSYSLSVRGIKLQEALTMAQQAVAVDSTNGAYLDTLGWIYFKMGDYQKALEYISRAVQYRDNSAEVMEHLGDVYEKLNDLENARLYWKRALELDEKRIEVRKKLGIQ
ncbi:MAG: tetratricopeptide repeat protein [candidate division KSB1 bacterium]|nr:tetratricopeptide repeat protein [candidate division KSB1 bacterium]MDZ7335998.1 tetratricopeptide repeat protein [candidate division KSB1 bacterium]MDZ7358709.1 tetratricopeptide repeat protein [candidate division KSB1 bacterium]MDZ7402012.1 tetratricopeptide repeat protein [candidate division KSB1 bacterium]